MVENLRICNLRTDMQLNQEKFADLKFLDSHILEIWGFLIANWAQEFGDLKNLHAHLCKFATVVNHTGGKVATGPPWAVNISANFWKILNGLMGYSGAWGIPIHEKTEIKNLVPLSL